MSSNRTFTIHDATTVNGCRTKIPHESRYNSSSAEGAAKKAHTVLCGRKHVKGVCTFIITMRETTQGSNKKLYTYKVTRHKLEDPVELSNGVMFEHEVIARKAHRKKKSRNCRHQSPGRMRGRGSSRSSSRSSSRRRSHRRSTRRKSRKRKSHAKKKSR
jgi:hypothetical protein